MNSKINMHNATSTRKPRYVYGSPAQSPSPTVNFIPQNVTRLETRLRHTTQSPQSHDTSPPARHIQNLSAASLGPLARPGHARYTPASSGATIAAILLPWTTLRLLSRRRPAGPNSRRLGLYQPQPQPARSGPRGFGDCTWCRGSCGGVFLDATVCAGSAGGEEVDGGIMRFSGRAIPCWRWCILASRLGVRRSCSAFWLRGLGREVLIAGLGS